MQSQLSNSRIASPRFLPAAIIMACVALTGCGAGAGYGTIYTVAGNGRLASSGDGGLAVNASLKQPNCIALDQSGNLFVGDVDADNVRRVDAKSHMISLYGGDGAHRFYGDGVPSSSASFYAPSGCTVGPDGALYIADQGNSVIRKVDPQSNMITTVVGKPYSSYYGDGYSSGDGQIATNATLNHPMAVAFDKAGNMFVADYKYVRRVDAKTRIITTVAGNGTYGKGGDGGLATASPLADVVDLAVDSAGNIFIIDLDAYAVRRIDAATGTISRFAGSGKVLAANHHLNGRYKANDADMGLLSGIAINSVGDIFISDQETEQIYRVDAAGNTLTVVAGKGGSEYSGDGSDSSRAGFHSPRRMVFDKDDNLFIADSYNSVVREVVPYR